MIAAFLCLLLFQLAGEGAARLLALPVPGPVLGMVGLLIALFLRPALHARLQATAHSLLSHLALFFIPAGVGVMAMLGDIRRNAVLLLAVIVLTTWLTALVSAAVFSALGRRA